MCGRGTAVFVVLCVALDWLAHQLTGGWACCTGWRRLIGSPKLQIIFHKRATKYRSLLRKMTYKDKGSYESSPPCNSMREREAKTERVERERETETE